jgi:hypothetical protein
MKRLAEMFQQSTKKLREDTVKKNPGLGMYKNQMAWAQENKRKIAELQRIQSQAIKKDFQSSKVVQTMYDVVSSLIPKSLPMQMLKLKIHLQTLIGNTLGIQFRGLEASKERLRQLEHNLIAESNPIKQQRTLHNPA